MEYQYQRCLSCNKLFPADYPDTCVYCNSNLVGLEKSTKCFECGSENIYIDTNSILCRDCEEWLGTTNNTYDEEEVPKENYIEEFTKLESMSEQRIKFINSISSIPGKKEVCMDCINFNNQKVELTFAKTSDWDDASSDKYNKIIGEKFGILYNNLWSKTTYKQATDVISDFIKFNSRDYKYTHIEAEHNQSTNNKFGYIYKTNQTVSYFSYGVYDKMKYWDKQEKDRYIELIRKQHGVIYDGKTVKLETSNADYNNRQKDNTTVLSSEICKNNIGESCQSRVV